MSFMPITHVAAIGAVNWFQQSGSSHAWQHLAWNSRPTVFQSTT